MQSVRVTKYRLFLELYRIPSIVDIIKAVMQY